MKISEIVSEASLHGLKCTTDFCSGHWAGWKYSKKNKLPPDSAPCNSASASFTRGCNAASNSPKVKVPVYRNNTGKFSKYTGKRK